MKRLCLGFAALAIALAGAACGDPQDGGGGAAAGGVHALAAAADNAAEAGSSAMTMTMTLPIAGDEMTAEAEGIFDFERQIGEMTMTVDGPGIARGFDDAEYDVIVEPEYGYMRMPRSLGMGTGWYRMSIAAPRVDATGIDQLTQDPTQFLEFLRAAAGDEVEEAGTAEIRGVQTTHYEAEISFEKALEQAPNQEAVEELEAKLGGSLEDLGTVPVEVWIDEDGLPRRIDISVRGMDVSAELFDYGIEVDTVIPEKFKELLAP